ncbi:CBO0543 family protein [Paenibacillus sp. S-38]|uniref:CBO0543 family protein n=1 Tax=Paenibacillus sp. S-38 TaxID=3416710 RepID=UPI003CEE03B3
MPYPSYEDILKARKHLSDLAEAHWVHDDLHKWTWWLLVILTLLPFYIWWKLVDRRRLQEILLYGMLIALFAITFDNIGTDRLWWGYPDKLLNVLPPLLPADLVLVPIFSMLVYQLFSGMWSAFLLANLVLGVFMAYVCEPLFILLNYYELYTWKLLYSLIYYLLTSSTVWWIVTRLKRVQERAGGHGG